MSANAIPYRHYVFFQRWSRWDSLSLCFACFALWIHEFQSLSAESMRFEYDGRAVWTPGKTGVAFKPLAGAPVPAKSSNGRLVQMRQLARRFSIKDDFEGASQDKLRLMTTPLLRYSSKSATDGALFTFAHGTDPELLVMLEVRAAGEDKAGGLARRLGPHDCLRDHGRARWQRVLERRLATSTSSDHRDLQKLRLSTRTRQIAVTEIVRTINPVSRQHTWEASRYKYQDWRIIRFPFNSCLPS